MHKEAGMPNITVEGPPVGDLEKKRKFVEVVTDAAIEMYGLPKQVIVVLLKENSPENVAVGGELIVDRAKQQDGTD